MWPFNRKYSLLSTGTLTGLTDHHSHILPGVDDGIQTTEDAMKVLEYYQQIGIRKVWLTPHIMEDIPNTTDKLRDRFHKLNLEHQKTGSPIQLHLSSENMIDSLFVKRLETNDLLPYGDNNDELLLETSYVQAPYGFHRILNDVKEAGYTPVLAHPERYQYMSVDDYETLHAKGVKFQLNLLSLTGAYGPSAQKRAEHLLSLHWYSYRGTDIHNLHNFQHYITAKTLKGDKTRFEW